MCKCKRCGRELTSKESVKKQYGPTCFRIVSLQKQEPIQEQSGLVNAVMVDLLERIRKVELDNNFMKYQLKHKSLGIIQKPRHPDANLDWKKNLKKEVQEVISVFEGKFVSIIKDLKEVIASGKPLLKEDFRYSNEELGIKPIEIIEVK